ncbi:MAG: sulfotransferase domain-containing protein [Magnetococcales bacterium]|nr:sulfotransferase domain-containing protein [Magnetococcales bacterium]
MKNIQFIGVGAPMSGSTTLAKSLFSHPDILSPLCQDHKEINFFTHRCDFFKKGPAWYDTQFQECQPGQITGEFSPIYFTDPESPRLISEFSPDVKLIAILRNPVKRSFSAYQSLKRGGNIDVDLTFRQAISKHEVLINCSRYQIHMKRYLRRFSRENIHLVILEELIENPAKVLNQALDFLGMSSPFQDDFVLAKANAGWTPKNRHMHNLSMGLRKTGRLLIPEALYRSQVAYRIKMLLLSLNKAPKEEVDSNFFNELEEEFREDNQELANMFNEGALYWT